MVRRGERRQAASAHQHDRPPVVHHLLLRRAATPGATTPTPTVAWLPTATTGGANLRSRPHHGAGVRAMPTHWPTSSGMIDDMAAGAADGISRDRKVFKRSWSPVCET